MCATNCCGNNKSLCTTTDSDPVHTTPFSNENDIVSFGYGYRPNYNAENDHRKRIVSKTLSRVERFENGTVWKRCFPCVEGENDTIWKTMTPPQSNTTWLQTTQPWVSQMEDKRFQAASLLIAVIFSLMTLLKAHLTLLRLFLIFREV